MSFDNNTFDREVITAVGDVEMPMAPKGNLAFPLTVPPVC
ncbi:hypothetical protein [Coxiella burnetii]|nr:hypothetical protein [Coxiella burnetii]ATN66532.1 hypothetical protein AYM17_03520 [Coxiella burnetii]ATN85969.1 hypothetical protein AYO29_05695 [Coxiella burnetii str. Schperling]EDQ95122.1 hypothetical protein A35_05765 [Coxiella burnetii 'MSU Goat Q177']EDR35959.1 hypothetical protein COXBURSA334_1312 [Coxiella burnetii Q321]OYK79679.1 hypothetical protein CbuD7E6568_06990 [Coxiella burnetii]